MAAQSRALIPHTRNPVSFRNAAASYRKHGGSTRYLDKVIDYFDDTPVDAIAPFDVRQMAETLYPTQSAATRNRMGIVPVRAVLIHAFERGWRPLIRISAFKGPKPKRKNPASPAWLQLFVRQCDKDKIQHVAALILFMAHTGARVSEAVRLEWGQVDILARRVVLLKTKTGINSVRHLTDELVNRLRSLSVDAKPGERVFRYRCRWSVNERIKAVCDRAGIAYKSTHACGRHSFATNALAMGLDIKTAMEAGDWKSSSIFIETYVHVKNAGRLVADRFNSMEFDPDV